ncbi:MAG: pyridoxamine 5'-phosphate oxidase family protein [Acidimicrobiia bacterium]|nr:pyridoxamine 5'-phosphate oxidase family protein [Acidimicrobiia bacterium]
MFRRRSEFLIRVTWADFASSEPEFASSVRDRFESHRHGVIATLRRDGAPRLSGIETPIRDGRLWLSMETASRMAQDLRRDPRFSIHSAPDHEDLSQGDARVEGRVAPALDSEYALFVRGHRFPIEDTSAMALFTTHITRVVLVRVEKPSLLVVSWTPDGGMKVTRLP